MNHFGRRKIADTVDWRLLSLATWQGDPILTIGAIEREEMVSERFSAILEPPRLWSRAEVLNRPCPVPREPGIYAWYFRDIPDRIPTGECIRHNGNALLYIGISPASPPRKAKLSTTQTLRGRIRMHMRGNAYGSTLRLSLGCLLGDELGIQLRRVGSGKRMTFADGEETLSRWMADNAFVCWMVYDKPWQLEDQLINRLSVPLNLRGNEEHPFHPILSSIRREARKKARELPVVSK